MSNTNTGFFRRLFRRKQAITALAQQRPQPIADRVPRGQQWTFDQAIERQFTSTSATGATIHETTGYPVAVCFDAQNLVKVAEALRRKYPTAHFVIAADNDVQTDGNPGITYAMKAAACAHGQVIYPQFGEIAFEEKLTDWNDMACWYSPETVTKLFTEALTNEQSQRR